MPTATRTHIAPETGARLVSVDGRALPLVDAALAVDARAGQARVVLRQRFANPHAEPLHVTYLLPLPADGAVSGFEFRLGDRRIVGEVDARAAARARFEAALVEGRSAALVEQDRSSVFTQEIGNVPPGAELTCEIAIDQPLVWRAPVGAAGEGGWEWRFPTTVAPRFLGAEGRVTDAARVSPDVADAPMGPRLRLTLLVRDAVTAPPASPSHALTTRALESHREVPSSGGMHEVALAEPARLDRDVVVRWPVAAPRVGLALDAGRPAAGRPHAGSSYGLVTLVPPSGRAPAVPRDLIVLLDVSGSMGGEPLDQARRVVGALIDTLGEGDQLELVAFSDRPTRWKRGAVPATPAHRRAAHAWLRGLEASGGTEMRSGILEAMAGLRKDAQRQVVLVSDGLIGFEQEIVAEVLARLPAGSRLHTLGVGSSVNRSLTGPAARAGRGAEVVVGLGEDPEHAARVLVAHTAAPLVVGLELEGSALLEHAPARLPDLFAGAPAQVAVRLRPEGGAITVRGRVPGGLWEAFVAVPALACGEGSAAAATRFARERVEDLETARAAGQHASEADAEITRLGKAFQIATRLTSWVAIDEHVSVDPRDPTRSERMPHELPYGMSMEGLGLRAPATPMGAASLTQAGGYAQAMMPMAAPAPASAGAPKGMGAIGGLVRRMVDALMPDAAEEDADDLAADEKELLSEAPAPEAREESRAGAPPPPARPAPKRERADKAKTLALRPALRGRLVRRDAVGVVIEIELDADLDWAPSGAVTITLADGRTVRAELDERLTTRAGRVPAGQRVRLALRAPLDPSDEPRTLALAPDLVIVIDA